VGSRSSAQASVDRRAATRIRRAILRLSLPVSVFFLSSWEQRTERRTEMRRRTGTRFPNYQRAREESRRSRGGSGVAPFEGSRTRLMLDSTSLAPLPLPPSLPPLSLPPSRGKRRSPTIFARFLRAASRFADRFADELGTMTRE